MAFDGRIKDAITAAKGRNAKAIAALLDTDALRTSKNQETDIKAALDALKKDNGYLFETETPPPYASGTGTQGTERGHEPMTLSGALHAKYDKNYFNPRPPRGGRRCLSLHLGQISRQISIHAPARGATGRRILTRAHTAISIHAPARGATGAGAGIEPASQNFNPRPREGGDIQRRQPLARDNAFQSTPPARGATAATCYHGSVCLCISIHAPREGGD